jgi:hypothetical protein
MNNVTEDEDLKKFFKDLDEDMDDPDGGKKLVKVMCLW